jgi:pimeloyl-ACP methyl ester carboxylesterase
MAWRSLIVFTSGMKTLLATLLLAALSSSPQAEEVIDKALLSHREVEYHDAARNRRIPVALYFVGEAPAEKSPVVIFSHGYGQNKGGDYKLYTYLTEHLAARGLVVASIQHELPDDEPLAMEGNFLVTRRSNWERGAANIGFVLGELKRQFPGLDYARLIIAGHSNGGDMSVVFAERHPDLVAKLITLDQRRYPFPRVSKPRIYSLRSSDCPADPGVLPSAEQQAAHHMRIVQLPATEHGNMDNDATETQRKEINGLMMEFLSEEIENSKPAGSVPLPVREAPELGH